jgi:hypothetical protein
MTTIPNLIAGRALVPNSGGARYADVFNPSRAEVIARVDAHDLAAGVAREAQRDVE